MVTRDQLGPAAVFLDVREQGFSDRTAARLDVAGADLALLDQHVRVQDDADQVVRRVTGDQALAAPVVGQPGLMDDPPVDAQRVEPVGDHHPGLDRGAGGDDMRPAQVLEPALGGQFR